MVLNINDTQFEETVINNTLPVLVDWWAPSCKPCVGMHPVLATLADKYNGQLVIAKVNVDENETFARTYGIRSLPTLMLVNEGAILGKKLGVMSGSQIIDWMNSLLGDATLNA